MGLVCDIFLQISLIFIKGSHSQVQGTRSVSKMQSCKLLVNEREAGLLRLDKNNITVESLFSNQEMKNHYSMAS